jgi:hypothetical protein
MTFATKFLHSLITLPFQLPTVVCGQGQGLLAGLFGLVQT